MSSIDVDAAHATLANDGGWTSRKFAAFIITVCAAFGAGILAAHSMIASDNIRIVCETVLAAFAVYCGVNLTTKFNAGSLARAAVAAGDVVDKPADPPKPADAPKV